ncbi:MAG: DUF4102 domain-containing protein [Acidobacteria bacterium]|nr:MAG: DUF4102 domain-containing protein [Acidobacteriota bacterium]REK04497.1 MAG: DUF4102 domain-containing protein [Acidobacteriota bacterium]
MKLTKRAVDAATVPEGRNQVFFWDAELKGFGLRVSAGGTKAYVVQYRTRNGRTRRLTLGRHGQLTPQQARTQAQRVLGDIAGGSDPAEDRRQGAKAPTIGDLARHYIEEHLRPKAKASTLREAERCINAEILGNRIGRLKAEDLTRTDVERFHQAIGKTRPTMANRALAYLQSMLNHAAERGRFDGTNPCTRVKRYRETRRERYLTRGEVERVAEALRSAERDASAPASAVLALRILLLTGMRVGEVLGLRWQDVDFERREIRLPDSKTGAKALPLTAPVAQLLAAAEHLEGNPYVITGKRPGAALVGLPKVWGRIRAAAGLEDVRLHDLRHNFGSSAVSSGQSLYITGKLLGHKQQSTTQRYAHLREDPVRDAAESIAGDIAAALGPTR